MVLYNVPGRSVADMHHEAAWPRLTQVPGIVGIRRPRNIERAQWLIRDVPQGFAVYSATTPRPWPDALRLARQHQRDGQRGAAPDARAVRGGHRRDRRRAMDIQFQLLPVHKNLFVEANPIPCEMGRPAHWPAAAPCACP